MGEYAEIELEREWSEVFEYEPPSRNFKEFRYANSDRWMQLNGNIIMMKDMSNRHLMNSIAMLERSDHDYSDCPAYHGLIKERQRRCECI